MATNVNWNPETSATQCKQIAAYLMRGKHITALDALNLFGCMALPRRICDLKEKGYKIQTQRIKTPTGKYVAEYFINEEDRNEK